MSKHNKRRVDENIIEKITVKKDPVYWTAVRSSVDAKIKVTGEVSRNRYTFNKAGSVVKIDERDVETLLMKRQGGRHCCGGTGFGNAVFNLVEET